MNKTRRKALDTQAEKLDVIKSDLESLRDEEQEYYDNMPEGLQCGEKGETALEAISDLDGAVASLDEAIEGVRQVVTV
jgi:hypothetical protein